MRVRSRPCRAERAQTPSNMATWQLCRGLAPFRSPGLPAPLGRISRELGKRPLRFRSAPRRKVLEGRSISSTMAHASRFSSNLPALEILGGNDAATGGYRAFSTMTRVFVAVDAVDELVQTERTSEILIVSVLEYSCHGDRSLGASVPGVHSTRESRGQGRSGTAPGGAQSWQVVGRNSAFRTRVVGSR